MKSKFIKQAGTFGPFLQVTPCYAMTYGMRKIFGQYSFSKIHLFYQRQYGVCYYSLAETKKIGDYYLEKARQDKNFIGKEYQSWLSKLKRLEELGPKLIREGDNDFLKEFYDHYLDLWARSIICEVYDDDFDERIKKLAQEFCVSIDEKEIIFLAQPNYLTIQLCFERELIQALDDHNDTEKIAQKYYFLDVDYFSAPSINLEKRIEEIRRRGLRAEAGRIKKLLDKIKEESKKKLIMMQEKALPPEFVHILNFFALLVEWRDLRKKMHQIGGLYLWRYIMPRLPVPPALQPYVFVLDYLNGEHQEKEYLNILKKRAQYVFFTLNASGAITTLYDKKRINRKIRNFEDKYKVVSDFRGQVANRGMVSGFVKIIKSTQDFAKLQKGDILVAPMTRPEYLPLIKKSAAVITDEGGITCHAAVISRELNIPCVIGTKIATQVLKDGDKVEVDANHGRIKILK